MAKHIILTKIGYDNRRYKIFVPLQFFSVTEPKDNPRSNYTPVKFEGMGGDGEIEETYEEVLALIATAEQEERRATFAAMFMQSQITGYIANDAGVSFDLAILATDSIKQADALLSQLTTTPDPNA